MFQKLFGASFGVRYFLGEFELWGGVVGRVMFVFEVHKGLPCDRRLEVTCGDMGLFKNIPMWCKSIVAVH